jgi:hypothetical protein
MVTIDDTLRAAWELVSDKPDIRLALIAAILSAQKNVEDNGAQVDCLREYVRSGFPTRSPNELYSHIAQHGMVSEHQCHAILGVMGSYERGELEHLRAMPSNGREWIAWRREVAHMYCLSWKTASFAALLMWPLECPFVPVDSHVCARFGLMDLYHSGKLSRKSKPSYRIYRGVERRVARERHAAGYDSLSLAVWHWYMWESWRQETGDSKAREGAESHAGLRAW